MGHRSIDIATSQGASNQHKAVENSPTPPPAMLDTKLATRAAQSDCTLLLTGDTGVGKGHLAHWLHQASKRSQKPFIPVNCGAIPENLIDSQLFGHAKGAFTGATTEHLGLVRAAEGGTLLLDEVSELPPSAQNRLLRLLQEHEVQPVGHSTPIIVDVRVIAATNADLKQGVEKKTFREDLLFRLDVIQLKVRPLRDRPEELISLLEIFNIEFAGIYSQDALSFEPKATDRLLHYKWPGNIRQLRTLVERLHVLCPNEHITVEHLVEIGQLHDLIRPGDGLQRLDQVKVDEVKRVIARSGGSVMQAAEIFGVHRSTIYRWLSRV